MKQLLKALVEDLDNLDSDESTALASTGLLEAHGKELLNRWVENAQPPRLERLRNLATKWCADSTKVVEDLNTARKEFVRLVDHLAGHVDDFDCADEVEFAVDAYRVYVDALYAARGVRYLLGVEPPAEYIIARNAFHAVTYGYAALDSTTLGTRMRATLLH
jgi:hypothetical protein